MNIGIEVLVYYLKSSDDVLTQDAGVTIDFEDCILKPYKIYNINYVTQYDKEKSILSTAGLDFIVNETYESLNNRIEQMQTFRFN